MANRFETISAVYENTRKDIVNSPQKWADFLSSACRNYKLKFDELVLIYAQKPNALAVLELEKWNKNFGRWVNAGAKSIAVIDDVSYGKGRLKYYFDIADTHETERSVPVPIWEMKLQYEKFVIDNLEKSFGALQNKNTLIDAVLSVSKNATKSSISDYTQALLRNKESSFLEELDDISVSSIYEKTVQNSVAYMIASRLGIDADMYFSREDFEEIYNFNSDEAINSVGCAVRDISEMVLFEVSKTVLSLESSNRTIDILKKAEYTDAVKEENEGSFNYDRNHIQQTGRLPHSEFSASEKREHKARQMVGTSQEIPEGNAKKPLHNTSHNLQARQPFERDTNESRGDGRSTYEADVSTGGLDRATQGKRYDDLGAGNEQPKKQSSGDNSKRGDLQRLNDDKLQFDLFDFRNDIETDSQTFLSSAFELPQQIIDEALCLGTHNEKSKLKIAAYFNKDKPIAENANFLKNLYQTFGTGFVFEEQQVSVWTDENSFRIAMGNNAQYRSSATVLSWEQAARRIRELLDLGRYMPQYMLDEVDKFERTDLAERIIFMARDIDDEYRHQYMPLTLTIFEDKRGFPDVANELADKMNNSKQLSKLIAELEEYADSVTENPDISRFPKLYRPYEILEKTRDLQIPQIEFTAQKGVSNVPDRFITDDEINNYIRSKGNARLEFYSYFKSESDAKNREKYLKEYFGIGGGHGYAYDGKGIEISHGSVFEPYAKTTVKWSDVQKRIADMIRKGTFLSDEDIEKLNAEKEEENNKNQNSFLPLYSDYLKTESENIGNLVLYQVGDFYEAMGDSAKIVSDELDLILTSRDVGLKDKVPLCGIPKHKLEDYLNTLTEKGNKVTVVSFDEKRERLETTYSADNDDNQNELPKHDIEPKKEQPNISKDEKHNFRLDNFNVEYVGPKERFKRNMAAIRILKECEFDNRFATPQEQEVLAQYVGWGGLSEAFDENNDKWSNEFIELYEALSPDEYKRAKESTLTAFYTPPLVISSMYKALQNFGFKRGNILEPSCAIGNFIGMLPEELSGSKIYGVELDSISASIAKQLYQNSSISNEPFEKTAFPDSFFDVAIGNVPFGDFKLIDKKYDKYNFLIHDYFFAKSLDKVRAGGIVIFITSKGTMDKENSNVRRYIAQRAELLGAIRLPDNTFKGNAGTEVTSDIIILQKRDRVIETEPDWLYLDYGQNNVKMNKYFVQHPEMILGNMIMQSGRFKLESACKAFKDTKLSELLDKAVSNIKGQITEAEFKEFESETNDFLPANPDVRNFSYTLIDGKIYYRENEVMKPIDASATAENRIKGMIGIRDSVRRLIELQTENHPDENIKAEQKRLNTLYDSFTSKYGLINSRGNSSAFSDDSSYFLISALEIIEDGELKRKADMFTKRTIKPHIPVTHADTASEALAISIGEKAGVDIAYIEKLTGKSESEIFDELQGVIFLNPLKDNPNQPKYLMADEYLSGNVREKLQTAKRCAELYPNEYSANVDALQKVQPKDLTAGEIEVRLGATWLPTDVIDNFVHEFLNVPFYLKNKIKSHYVDYTGEWYIEGKSLDSSNIKANSTYGTDRINAFKIIEATLNLKDVKIFDYEEDSDGKRKAILNIKETQIAQAKQEQIKQAFKDWIWKEPERRERLCKMYNEKFNSIRPREYDGSHLIFSGINPEINLRPHQLNAIAHILYGGNTLLAHAVGAGKTFEMVAAAMESKRLGLCSKSMFVVPNHLIEQWASEFLQLYPSANILVASKKDFEAKNRKRFCSRIATGDYDAVILGHSQFEKIPISVERQIDSINEQIDDILLSIVEAKGETGSHFTVKQLEKSKKALEARLEKLNNQDRKDDVITFDELGVDRIFIDESHYFKNLFLYTKMRNVAGIGQAEAQKSSDLYMKCRYLDEITGGKGVIFATGTPVSNSMVELYTIQRYLQYDTLQKQDLLSFDAWASTFGETVTTLELKPEGTGYRPKTRFARFYNLPELMSMFKEIADIQTADMLNLPVPNAHFNTIAVKPSEMQKDMVNSLAERAEAVRNSAVAPDVDNMLKITNDGRKLALDQRLINPLLPDFESSKVNACVDSVIKFWEDGKEERLAQLVFCDLSTPKGEISENIFTDVYNDIRTKLIARGIPENEIAFIHNANTDQKKKELFAKVRRGDVRVLLGSTQKMGAGTNVQERLIALHDIDCPWRPSDLEQRAGRIIRQGNKNSDVYINRYVTENTFDAYLYQIIETKQKFISQIYTSKTPARSAEDVDEAALSYAEIKMLATGNPHIKEKMELDLQVSKLKMLKSSFMSEKYSLEDKVVKFYPAEIARLKSLIKGINEDIQTANEHPAAVNDSFAGMVIFDKLYTDKAEAGLAIINACKSLNSNKTIPLGKYRGFKMELLYDSFGRVHKTNLKGALTYTTEIGTSELGNITRLDNVLKDFEKELQNYKNVLLKTEKELEDAKADSQREFPQEAELQEKLARLNELNAELKVNEQVGQVIDVDADERDISYQRNKTAEVNR